MLRITIHDNAELLRLQLDGRLADPWVRELEMCWRTASSTLGARGLQVDLRKTTEVDSQGRDLLTRLGRAGAAFLAADSRMATLVEAVTGKPAIQMEPALPRMKRLAQFLC